MFVLCLTLYALLGAAAGWASMTFLNLELPIAAGAGVAVTLVLSQIHVLATRKGKTEELETRIDQVEKDAEDTAGRVKVVEARTDAVEATLKQELTERRDALVSEMQQLESVIDRLSRNFERRPAVSVAADNTKDTAPQDDQILRAVKDALEAGRIDLHLQPVVSLPQRKVSFYESFCRLRREDGALILPGEFMDAARRAKLMGVIDNLMLYRSVEIVRRLMARDRRVGVFCNISAYSLRDAKFFPIFLSYMHENRDLAGAIIFELPASAFVKRDDVMEKAMQRLSSLGFRFSIDQAETLNLDLQSLQHSGIRFLKMKGSTMVEQLRDPDGPRPVSSVNRKIKGNEVSAVCSRYGVTLVAEKLEEEVTVVEILEFTIPYAQGHVLGAVRPIKSDLMEETAPPRDLVKKLVSLG